MSNDSPFPDWRDLRIENCGGVLLDDAPDDENAIPHLFEQDNIARNIEQVVGNFLLSREPGNAENLFVAIHGRFGQGKSQVVKEITKSFHTKTLRGHGTPKAIWVEKFNCANYSTKDLTENFDHFIEGSRGKTGLWLLLVLLIFFPIFYILLGVLYPEISNINKTVLQAFVGVLVAPFAVATLLSYRLAMRDLMREFRLGKGFWASSTEFIHRLTMSNDILIIDDLDRASVAQQTAMLQSLRRHNRDFKGAVIVVFDDAPLLEAMDNKPKSAELLSKVFDVSFRLSPMTARDAAEMAANFTKQLLDKNKGCATAALFKHPFIIGDLARVYMLHGNASARFAKKLVNNVYTSAMIGQYKAAADISALLRLHGLFHYVPEIEAGLDEVASSLLDGTEQELVAYIEGRFGNKIPEAHEKRLLNFLANTHHMRPSNVSWLRLLRVWRGQGVAAPKRQMDFAPAGLQWDDAWSFNWAINDAFLASRRKPERRQKIYVELLQKDFAGNKYVHNELEDFAVNRAPPKNLNEYAMTNEQIEYWVSMVERLRIHDDELLGIISAEERKTTLENHQKNLVGHLVTSRAGHMQFDSLKATFSHCLFATDSQLEQRLKYELKQYFEADMAKGVKGLEVSPTFSGLKRKDTTEALELAWPAFGFNTHKLTYSREIIRHFREFSKLVPLFPEDRALFPAAHMTWVVRALRNGDNDLVYRALCLLLPKNLTPGKDFLLPTGVFKRFWERLNGAKLASGFSAFIIKKCLAPELDSHAFWMLLQWEDIKNRKDLSFQQDILPAPLSELSPFSWNHPIIRNIVAPYAGTFQPIDGMNGGIIPH